MRRGDSLSLGTRTGTTLPIVYLVLVLLRALFVLLLQVPVLLLGLFVVLLRIGLLVDLGESSVGVPRLVVRWGGVAVLVVGVSTSHAFPRVVVV